MTEAAPAPASFLVQNYGRAPIRFVRGQGCRLWDDEGRSYLDAFAGVAVSALGHAHPRLVQTIAHQAATLTHVSNHYTIPEQEALAAKLVPAAFPGRVLFCNSGTEANECAVKVVRLWGNQVHGGKKTRLIAFQGGFHGRTLGSLALTYTPKYRESFGPLAPVDFVPLGDVAAFDTVMGDDVAGVFIEPIQGEGGVNIAPAGFLAHLRAACDRFGAVLVVDEVQTGMGRTGTAFGYQQHGIVPDLITLAKGLGGGVAIGAALMKPHLADLLKPGLHGTTFGGNPLACAVGLVVADEVLKPAFLAQVTARGEQLQAGLRQAIPDAIEVRGQGLLVGVQLPVDPSKLVAACRDQGVIVGPSGNNTLRLAPPLIITAEEVDELVAAIGRAWAAIR